MQIAWLGGHWVPFDRLLEGVIQFRLISRLENLAAPAAGSSRATASDQRSD